MSEDKDQELRYLRDKVERLTKLSAEKTRELERIMEINKQHCNAVNTYIIHTARLSDRIKELEDQLVNN